MLVRKVFFASSKVTKSAAEVLQGAGYCCTFRGEILVHSSICIIIFSFQHSSTLLLSLIFILTIIERLKIVVCQFGIDHACPGERERCSAHILGGAAPSQSLSLTLSWIILDCDIEIIITLRTYLSLTLSLIILYSDIDIEIIIVLDFDIEVILVIGN